MHLILQRVDGDAKNAAKDKGEAAEELLKDGQPSAPVPVPKPAAAGKGAAAAAQKGRQPAAPGSAGKGQLG